MGIIIMMIIIIMGIIIARMHKTYIYLISKQDVYLIKLFINFLIRLFKNKFMLLVRKDILEKIYRVSNFIFPLFEKIVE